MLVLALLWFAGCTTWTPQPFAVGEQAKTPQEVKSPPAEQRARFIFHDIEPELRSKTGIPLRLPGFLPDVDAEHPIYATVESATQSGYEILLAVILPCTGGNNCLYGTVAASSSPFELENEAKPVPVKLTHGIEGQFIEFVCHAYCSQAFVRWHEGTYYYSIGIKAEKKQAMIEVANSSIDVERIKAH